MNHLNNDPEELLSNSKSNSDRHFEMFLERSRFTGWMFVVSIGVAVVILFKVLTPFQGLNEELVGHSTELAVLKQHKHELYQRRNSIETISYQFEAIQHRIQNPSWANAPKRLAGQIRELNRSYRVLLDASNEDLTRFLKDLKENGDAVGFADGETRAMPASFRDGDALSESNKWMSPPENSEDEKGAVAPLDQEQISALQAYFEAAEQVREMGLLTEPVEIPQPEKSGEQELDRSDLPQQPAWMSMPPPSIGVAIRTLHVSPEELIDFATFRERDTFLYEKLQNRAKEEAHKILDQVAQAARAEVVVPLRESLNSLNEIELSHIVDEFERLETTVNDWENEHKSNSTWYQTAASKGETVVGLRQSIGNVLANTSAALDRQSVAVQKARMTMDYRLRNMEAEGASLKKSQASIQSRLDSIMPALLTGIVTASELIQIFPMLLIALLLVISYNVWMVRDHFLLSRIDGVDRAPYKSASIWTLVQRGGFRTMVSLITFLGGIAILWFNYEQAAILMTRWAALDIASPWMFTGWISKAAPWIGRTVFLAAASAVVLCLLWREQASASAEPAQ